MDGVRESYERDLWQRDDKKLEESRAGFWTKIVPTSKLNRVRERSKGAEADWKTSVNTTEAAEGKKRNRDESDRLRYSLWEAEGKMYRIISELQGLWRAKKDFDWRIEDLGVHGDEGVRLVKSDIDSEGKRGEVG